MKLDNYVCENQISMFDFMSIPKKKDRFCGDDRINRIVDSINEIFDKIKHKLPTVKNVSLDYAVWDHVPSLGYRLSISYSFDCKFVNIPELYCGVGQISLYNLFEYERLFIEAEEDKIELSISITPNMLLFSTLDHSKRKKVKKEEDEVF